MKKKNSFFAPSNCRKTLLFTINDLKTWPGGGQGEGARGREPVGGVGPTYKKDVGARRTLRG